MTTWSLTVGDEPTTLEQAKKRMAEVQRDVRQIIKIMTAEQALKAQRVVREAGRRR